MASRPCAGGTARQRGQWIAEASLRDARLSRNEREVYIGRDVRGPSEERLRMGGGG